ncbi:MAG: sensor histidine kinase, partial [Verrucomicrobiota bacterium]
RRILARELHDEIGQTLTFFKLAVDMCLRLPLEQVREKLSEASGKVGKLVDQVRNLSLELRPTLLDDLGLLPALRWLIGRFTENTGIEVDFRHRGLEGCRFATGTETAVYRIVQEGLTNVARHARIQRASVKVWRDSLQLQLQIGDGGCGFEATALTAGTSSGLCGLRERARLAGGQLNIESALGKGTVITASLSAHGSAEGLDNET